MHQKSKYFVENGGRWWTFWFTDYSVVLVYLYLLLYWAKWGKIIYCLVIYCIYIYIYTCIYWYSTCNLELLCFTLNEYDKHSDNFLISGSPSFTNRSHTHLTIPSLSHWEQISGRYPILQRRSSPQGKEETPTKTGQDENGITSPRELESGGDLRVAVSGWSRHHRL